MTLDEARVSLFNKFVNTSWFQAAQKTATGKLVVIVSEENDETASLCRDGWEGHIVEKVILGTVSTTGLVKKGK